MSDFQQVKTKYLFALIGSVCFCFGLLFLGRMWLPIKYTQTVLLENDAFRHGMYRSLVDLEENIQKGTYPLQDNVPYNFKMASYNATVTKMTDQKKLIPYTKYHVELQFLYPHSTLRRYTKLDAILVDTNIEQNHDFADLFWKVE